MSIRAKSFMGDLESIVGSSLRSVSGNLSMLSWPQYQAVCCGFELTLLHLAVGSVSHDGYSCAFCSGMPPSRYWEPLAHLGDRRVRCSLTLSRCGTVARLLPRACMLPDHTPVARFDWILYPNDEPAPGSRPFVYMAIGDRDFDSGVQVLQHQAVLYAESEGDVVETDALREDVNIAVGMLGTTPISTELGHILRRGYCSGPVE